MGDLRLKLRYNLDQNADAEPSEWAADVNYNNGLRGCLQYATYEKE